MSLPPVYGHDALLNRLDGAIASGRFPQAALLVGPPGVGKQRLALRLARALLCERGPGTPCEACRACRMVVSLSHPDVHWFVPVPRPKAGDPDKQVDEVEQALADVMAERRQTGRYERPQGLVSHSLASIRLLQRRVALTPFQGRRKVVVLGDAERLIVQEASPEAANALLKVLEEPPADTTVFLTAAEPQALLPTIRSRAVPIRVGPVPDQVVRAFLERELDDPPTGRALEQRVALGEGSIGRALWSAAATDEAAREAAAQFLRAVRAGTRTWAATALAQLPWSARGDFTTMLDALAVQLRDELAAGAAHDAALAGARARAVRRVEQIRAEAQGNANPQLALAVLARDLQALV